jgi:DNA modification methylase
VIIQGDCLDVMAGMKSKSVDMVLTSPPFKDEDVDGDYWNLYDSWFKEMERVTSKVVCIIHSATKLNRLIAEYPPKRVMIWGKGFSQYSYRWNPILLYQQSDDYKINKFIWSDSFGIQSVQGKNKLHKYQDPLLLYQTIIRMFKGCEVVLDPFTGSGTTGEACALEGRQFIGIELNPEYVKLAEKRLLATPQSLFNQSILQETL